MPAPVTLRMTTTARTSKKSPAVSVDVTVAAERRCVTFHTNPVPASRPRFRVLPNKSVVAYYDGAYKQFFNSATEALKPKLVGIEPMQGVLRVDMLIVVEKPKTTRRSTPSGDVDNYAKGVLDVLTAAGMWGDDDQVASLFAHKRFASPGEAPRAFVEVWSWASGS